MRKGSREAAPLLIQATAEGVLRPAIARVG